MSTAVAEAPEGITPPSPQELAARLTELRWRPNATFQSGPKPQDFQKLDIVRAFLYGLIAPRAVRILGDPGTGKTAFLLWMAEKLGVDVVYIPAAQICPEDLAVPMPTDQVGADGKVTKVLDFLLYRALTSPRMKIIVIDELSRASIPVRNQLLEMVQERRLADHLLVNVVGIYSLDNEGKENGITKEPDLALSTRFITVKINPNETPWRQALAEEFADHDLTDVFKLYKGLSPRLRYLLSPRTLHHVMWNLLHGQPGIWGLPVDDNGNPRYLIDEQGEDVTDDILDRIADALGVENRSTMPNKLVRAVENAIRFGKNLYVVGNPGIGKTGYIRSAAMASGCDVKVLSAPVVSPDSLTVPYPVHGELDIMVMRWLAQSHDEHGNPIRKILIIDEIWRCSPATRDKLMEILQQGTIGGKPIPGLVCVIAMNNPKEVGVGEHTLKLEVGTADRAQADRFFMNVKVTEEDVPWKDWMLRTYGEEAEPFIQWREEDLGSDAAGTLARFYVCPRVLEAMIFLVRQEAPLLWALPYIKGDYVKVPTHQLEARLADRTPIGIRAIAERIDDYVEALKAAEASVAQTEVFFALGAELVLLEEHREVVVRLLQHLAQNHLLALAQAEPTRQKFMREALREARERTKAEALAAAS